MKFELTIDENREETVHAVVHKPSEFTDELELLVMQYDGSDSITAYSEDEIKIIKLRDVECITVIDGKTYVIDSTGKRYKIKRRLYEAAQELPASFIKINKSTIANKTRIERFSAVFSGSVDVIFKSGYTDYVSRRCFAEIKKELK